MKKSLIIDKVADVDASASYRRTVLDNGIRVVSESIPYVKSISIGVWVNVGSRDEDRANNGITHFIEHMVFKGTKKREASKIAEMIEGVGGYINAFTTKENTCFYIRAFNENLELAVDILSDLIQNPLFELEEIEKEKQVVIEEIKDIEDDMEEYVTDFLEHKIFYPHPLGFPIHGTRDTVLSFTRRDMISHMRRFYIPRGIVISAAGNLEHDELVKYVKRYFRLRNTNGHVNIRRQPSLKSGKVTYLKRPTAQSHVCLGTVVYGARSSKRAPFSVLNTIIGDGMSSRLFQKVREKYGLVYTIYSFYSLFSDVGLFGIYFACDPENVDEAMKLVEEELRLLKEKPVGRDELNRAKSQLKGSLLIGLESMSNRMTRLAQIELIYNGKYISIDNMIRNIDAVTEEHVQNVACEMFNLKNFEKVIINPVS